MRRIIKPTEFVDKVIFNGTHTIVKWSDGRKTIVNCNEGDEFDKEKGIALCFMKRFCGNTGAFNEVLKEYAYEDEIVTEELIPITKQDVQKMTLGIDSSTSTLVIR